MRADGGCVGARKSIPSSVRARLETRWREVLARCGSDKVVHLIAFAALSFPLARTGRFGLLPVFVGASAFGGVIELIQPSFNRSADLNDWIADIVGVALGIVCGLMYRRLRPH